MLSRTISRLREGDDLWAGAQGDVIALHGPDGRLRRVSDSARSLLGEAPTALIGKRLTDLLADDEASVALGALGEACRDGAAGFRARTRSGRVVEAGISRTPHGLRTVLRDASALVEREAALRARSDRAVARANRRTEHLANVSHEIRTPLSAVIGFADALQEESFGPVGHERYRDYARIIHESGKHLLSLVSDLLDLSKAEEGEVPLDVRRTDVRALVRTCVEIMHLQAEEAGLYLDAVLPDRMPAVLADEKILRQIVLNLIGNALKFTREGGVTIMVLTKGDALLVEVHDTGVGMSQGDLALVGQRFKQARAEGVRGARGTGIGLSLSQALAAVHGGELTLSSAEGKGTTAILRLPLVPAPARSADLVRLPQRAS